MRAIQIDSYLEEIEAKRAARSSDAVSQTSFDWGRIVAEGRAARAATDGGRWRVGQLAVLVESRYASGAMQRFADEIGESYGTIRRYRWVAKAYDEAARVRFAGLSFSHFQAVAGLPDREVWLGRADRGRWSVDRLVRESRERSEPGPPVAQLARTDALDRLRSSIDQVLRWIEPASLADDVATSAAGKEWLIEALDDLAEQIGRLRQRVHQAGRVAEGRSKPVRPGRPKAPRRRTSSARSRSNALKARAIGR